MGVVVINIMEEVSVLWTKILIKMWVGFTVRRVRLRAVLNKVEVLGIQEMTCGMDAIPYLEKEVNKYAQKGFDIELETLSVNKEEENTTYALNVRSEG